MSRWFGRVKVVAFTTLGLCGGWKARAAWEEMMDAARPASMLARLSRAVFSESGGDAKDRRVIREMEGKLHAANEKNEERVRELLGKLQAANEKNEELQMRMDGPSNRHEFPPLPPEPQPQPQRP